MATMERPVPPQNAAASRRFANHTANLLSLINRQSREALKERSAAAAARTHKETLAAHHPEYALADLRWVAVWSVIVITVAVIWAIDVCLMGSVAEYLASIVFHDHPYLVQVARAVVSFGILMLEMFISAMAFTALVEAEENGAATGRLWLWRGLGLVLALFIVVCVVATQVAAGSMEAVSTRYLMYGLAGFAFVLHLLVPLADRHLPDAKGYLVFRLRNRKLTRAESKATRRENELLGEVEDIFPKYTAALSHAGTKAGIFTHAARTVILERFGAIGEIEPAQADTLLNGKTQSDSGRAKTVAFN